MRLPRQTRLRTPRPARGNSLFTVRHLAPLVACCLLLSGCGGFFVPVNGGGGGGGNTGNYLYVANSTNGTLAGFNLSGTGTLTAVPKSPVSLGVVATGLAITPNNKFLYVGAANGVYLYAIQSDGSLILQNSGSTVATDVLPSAMQVDATGNYLLAAGLANGAPAIGIYQINTTSGVLSALKGSPLALYAGPSGNTTLVVPNTMLITPSNALVYVSLGVQGVQVLTLGSGGALSNGSAPTLLKPLTTHSNASDQGLATDPKSTYLFVAEINSGLRVLTIGASGGLTEVANSPFTTGTGPSPLALANSGATVYVGNRGDSTLSAFTLGAGGALTAVAGSPFSSGGSTPAALTVDKTGKYLAVVNSGGNKDLQLFTFDAAGKLVAGSNATTGTDPVQPNLIAATH